MAGVRLRGRVALLPGTLRRVQLNRMTFMRISNRSNHIAVRAPTPVVLIGATRSLAGPLFLFRSRGNFG
jgi:hypothetical protein